MERLKSIKRIILSVGHGGLTGEDHDSGAEVKGFNENDQCRMIAGYLCAELTKSGFAVLVIPDWGLQKSINYINSVGNTSNDWAIEIHRDSADNFNPKTMARRCGVYFLYETAGSAVVAKSIANCLITEGAHTSSWARADTESPRKRLAFIRQPKMLSHIIELGFIQDNNTEAECKWYAVALAKSLVKVLSILTEK